MQVVKSDIQQWLQANRQSGIELLQAFVQADSVQGNEEEVQRLVLKKLEQLGLEIDTWEPDGEKLQKHPYFASNRTDFSGSPNVVGVMKGSGEGRSIVLNGHIDVVPAGDLEQWEHNPYSGEIIDGKMYGRGTTDMKGGNVALLLAIEAIRALRIPLKGDVIFHSVIEEESGGTGTLDAVLKGYTADAALIPEPTNMKIFPKQQGSMWFRLTVKGRSAHGGTRYEGVSAIEKSLVVTEHVRRLEEIRNKRITDPLYDNIPIPIPINIGRIEGGEWPSSVADLVKIEGRMGIAPEETIDEAKAEMEQWIQRLGEVDEWFKNTPVKLEWYGARWLPGAIETEHELMEILTDSYRSVNKEEPVIEASPWGTDGGLLTNVGNTPSIVFGPGVTQMAHFPNEYIELDKVFQAAEIIALTIINWCGVQK
ncbi:peptidase [Bacillus tianshenii]|nr:peptidase [Bacillus tianshenii]